jgi:hypothetical protein
VPIKLDPPDLPMGLAIWHGEAVDALRSLLEQHRSTPFPSAVVRGEDYGEVDAVMIDADIFGWGLRAADGDLTATDRERLEAARDELLRSLPDFPAPARPYYETLLKIARLALRQDPETRTHLVRRLVVRVIDDQDFEEKETLLAQVPYLQVLSGPLTFLKPTVDRARVAPSRLPDGPVPGQSWVIDDLGNTLGTLLVWMDDGYISALEYGWVADQPPLTLPAVTQIQSTP